MTAGGDDPFQEGVRIEEMLRAESAEPDAVAEFMAGGGGFIGGEHLADGMVHGGGEHKVVIRVQVGDFPPVATCGFDDDRTKAGGGGLPAFVEREVDTYTYAACWCNTLTITGNENEPIDWNLDLLGTTEADAGTVTALTVADKMIIFLFSGKLRLVT